MIGSSCSQRGVPLLPAPLSLGEVSSLLIAVPCASASFSLPVSRRSLCLWFSVLGRGRPHCVSVLLRVCRAVLVHSQTGGCPQVWGVWGHHFFKCFFLLQSHSSPSEAPVALMFGHLLLSHWSLKLCSVFWGLSSSVSID